MKIVRRAKLKVIYESFLIFIIIVLSLTIPNSSEIVEKNGGKKYFFIFKTIF